MPTHEQQTVPRSPARGRKFLERKEEEDWLRRCLPVIVQPELDIRAGHALQCIFYKFRRDSGDISCEVRQIHDIAGHVDVFDVIVSRVLGQYGCVYIFGWHSCRSYFMAKPLIRLLAAATVATCALRYSSSHCAKEAEAEN